MFLLGIAPRFEAPTTGAGCASRDRLGDDCANHSPRRGRADTARRRATHSYSPWHPARTPEQAPTPNAIQLASNRR
jgi:hypothetical protein